MHLHLNFFLDRKDKTPKDLDPVQVRKHTKAEVGQTRQSKTGNHRHLDLSFSLKGRLRGVQKLKYILNLMDRKCPLYKCLETYAVNNTVVNGLVHSLTLIPPSGGLYGSQFFVGKMLEVHKGYDNETIIYSSSF